MTLTCPIVLCFLLLQASGVKAQNVMLLQGQVLDEKTRKPVLYSSVSVTGSPVNTMTSLDGRFVMKAPSLHGDDSLIFTSLAYEPFTIPVSAASGEGLVVRVRKRRSLPENLPLNLYKAEVIIKRAVEVAYRNHLINASFWEVTYDDTIALSPPHIYLARALFRIYSRPSAKPSLYRNTEFIKGRITTPYATTQKTVLPYPYPPNTQDLLNLDITSQETSVMGQRGYREYKFRLMDYTSLNGKTVLVLGFEPKNVWKTKADFIGRIFIDPISLAVVKAEFRLSDGMLLLYNRGNNWYTPRRTIQRTFIANYTQQQGKWVFAGGSIVHELAGPTSQSSLFSKATFRVTRWGNANVDTFRKEKGWFNLRNSNKSRPLIDYIRETAADADQVKGQH